MARRDALVAAFRRLHRGRVHRPRRPRRSARLPREEITLGALGALHAGTVVVRARDAELRDAIEKAILRAADAGERDKDRFRRLTPSTGVPLAPRDRKTWLIAAMLGLGVGVMLEAGAFHADAADEATRRAWTGVIAEARELDARIDAWTAPASSWAGVVAAEARAEAARAKAVEEARRARQAEVAKATEEARVRDEARLAALAKDDVEGRRHLLDELEDVDLQTRARAQIDLACALRYPAQGNAGVARILRVLCRESPRATLGFSADDVEVSLGQLAAIVDKFARSLEERARALGRPLSITVDLSSSAPAADIAVRWVGRAGASSSRYQVVIRALDDAGSPSGDPAYEASVTLADE